MGIGAQDDITMWLNFLDDFNEDVHWTNSPDMNLYTDAAGGIGFGAYSKGKWAEGRWSFSTEGSPSIAYMDVLRSTGNHIW